MNMDKVGAHLESTMQNVVFDTIENLEAVKGDNYAKAVKFAFKVMMFQSASVNILAMADLREEIAGLMDMLHDKALMDILFTYFAELNIDPKDTKDILEKARNMVDGVEQQSQIAVQLAS